MEGKLYAVGVGSGDPELLTLKAVNIINSADVIACPAKGDEPGIAYRIAEKACPDISRKQILPLSFPMERGDQSAAHRQAAEQIIHLLGMGKNVAFLTLGDPMFYSTFSYLSDIAEKAGYTAEIINGVPSFCAASGRINIPLAIGDESVMITSGEYKDFDGTLIIMKAGSRLKSLKERIAQSGKTAFLVENCGMENEKIYRGVDEIPDKTGYFSLLIVK